MIEEIKLNEKISIYKTKLNLSDIDKLISDIHLNLDVSSNTKKPLPNEPGIQSTLVISTPAISTLLNGVLNIFFEKFKLPTTTPYFMGNWIYVSDSSNTYFGWHTHMDSKNTIISPKWTYTYYVQMPDNLIGDDGKLAFKLDDGSIHMIMPEVDDLLIFPCTLLHAPMNNTNSNIERIVFAGVWSDIDTTIPLRKKNKTLF
jgi:hypothetical protein